MLLETPLVQATHLAQILLALLPGAQPIVFTAAEIELTLAPGLLFTQPPFITLLFSPLAIAIIVVACPTILLRNPATVFIALSLPIALLLVLLALLCLPLLPKPALLVILPCKLILPVVQTSLFLGLTTLLFKQSLLFVISPLFITSTTCPVALAFLLSTSLLIASLLVGQTSLFLKLSSLLILNPAGEFCLPSLFLFLALLLPLATLVRALLILTLPFSLALLFLSLLIVAALLFSLASLLSLFIAPVSVLILVLVRSTVLAAAAAVFSVVGILRTGQAVRAQKGGYGEG
ncbi:MAG TPA: hypothetical protein VFU37_23875 [Pyrinomonadaceae bacterium]|nr:hypothetical protein [Pyrinomonadaceae bacterium]